MQDGPSAAETLSGEGASGAVSAVASFDLALAAPGLVTT